jgi:hypothetical protein
MQFDSSSSSQDSTESGISLNWLSAPFTSLRTLISNPAYEEIQKSAEESYGETEISDTNAIPANNEKEMSYQASNEFSYNAQNFPKNLSNAIKTGFSHSEEQTFRFVSKQGDFLNSRKHNGHAKGLNVYEIFYYLVGAPTLKTITLLLLFYTVLVMAFATLYYFIGIYYGCHLGIKSFNEAFLFALETMATVGYSTNDIFFDDCYSVLIVVTIQLLVRIVTDSFTVGVIYTRLARPSARANTLLFSCNAIIRRIRGKLYFMMQICETRSEQLLEAHIRLYVIKKEKLLKPHGQAQTEQNKVYFRSYPMRLNHPNDELGGMLLLCAPQVIVHEINADSPLMPPPRWTEYRSGLNDDSAPICHTWRPPAYDFALHSLNTKSNELKDLHVGSTEYNSQILSGLFYPNVSHRSSRGDAFQDSESQDGWFNPPQKSEETSGLAAFRRYFQVSQNPSSAECGEIHGDEIRRMTAETDRQAEECKMIDLYMKDRDMEVIAIVEGIDSATNGAVQCRKSFKSSDIMWNMHFAPCAFEHDGVPAIDLEHFNKYVHVDRDSAFADIP